MRYRVRVRHPREGVLIPDQKSRRTYTVAQIEASRYIGPYVDPKTGDDFEALHMRDGVTAVVACTDIWIEPCTRGLTRGVDKTPPRLVFCIQSWR